MRIVTYSEEMPACAGMTEDCRHDENMETYSEEMPAYAGMTEDCRHGGNVGMTEDCRYGGNAGMTKMGRGMVDWMWE